MKLINADPIRIAERSLPIYRYITAKKHLFRIFGNAGALWDYLDKKIPSNNKGIYMVLLLCES